VKVNINHARIEGFLSIGPEVQVNIENGVTSIVGENRTDRFSTSNGSGKSAIIESIVWCLTGSTSRGIKNDEVVNLYYKPGCVVTVDLSIGGENYEITRTRGHESLGNSLSIRLDGEDISGNTATKSSEILQSILPFDYNDLTTMIILSQGLPGKLSAQKPSGRKAILESIASYSDKVEELKNRSIDHKSSIERDLVEAESSRKVVVARIEMLSSDVVRLSSELEKEIQQVAEYSELAEKLREENKSIEIEVDNAKKSYETKCDMRNKIGDEKSEISSRVSAIKLEAQNLQSQYNSMKNEHARVSSELSTSESKLKSYEQPSPVCPTCHQTIGDRSVVEELKAYEVEKIDKSNEVLTRLSLEMSQLGERISDISKKPAQDEEALSQLQSKLQLIDAEISSLRMIAMKQVKPIPEFHDRTQKIRDEINEKVEESKRISDGIVALDDRVSLLGRRLEVAKNISYDISRGEFRAFVLRKVIRKFNELLATVSEALMRDDVVRLEESDNGDIQIKYKDKKFEQMSGGERCRIDLALELTKRMYKSIVSGVKFNLLAMDEVTDGLDSFGISAIFDAVSVSNNVDSFLVISHRDEAVDYDRRIRVVKENNLSSVVVE
jgi:DNA repair exonuclease SbcCD ATPase subunit